MAKKISTTTQLEHEIIDSACPTGGSRADLACHSQR